MITFFTFTILVISKQLFLCVQLMLNMAYEQVWSTVRTRHQETRLLK